jgi:uncharacterized protein YceK
MKKLFLLLPVLAILSGCGATLVTTPENKVFAAHQTYDAALTVAVTYKELPACAKTDSPVCSDAGVVATIQSADKVAYEALMSAQKVVRAPKATTSALQTAVTWATEAINAFKRVTDGLKVK